MANSDQSPTPPKSSEAILLIAMSIVGVGIGYAASIVTARLLGPEGFQDYAVAVATLGLMCAIAEAGTGKFSLKTLPGYAASQQWSLASGYWRFSLRTVLIVSICLAVCVALPEKLSDGKFGSHPLGVGVLFLPFAALCGVGIDLIMANRAAISGMLIARILLPATTLTIILTVGSTMQQFTSTVAILCYGAGAFSGLIYCTIAFLKSAPKQLLETAPEYHFSEWLPQCAYFAVFSFLVSWTLKISLVVLELLPVPEAQVACFAAALDTGCLILLLAKSTDKMFQPEMSVILAKSSWDAGLELRKNRYALVGSGCSLFMLVMVLFGKSILELFGREFVPGYPALCFVSAGASVQTMFSLAPAFLRFSGHNRFVIGTTITGAVCMVSLTALLGTFYGATGAGIAFGLTMTVTSLAFLIRANQHISVLTDTDSNNTNLN